MISFNDNSFISNTYSATGEKLSTVYVIRMAPVLSPLSSGETAEANDRDGGISGGGSGTPEPQAGQIRHYCGNVVYDMGVGAEIAAFIHTHGASCFTHWGNEFSGIRDDSNTILND